MTKFRFDDEPPAAKPATAFRAKPNDLIAREPTQAFDDFTLVVPPEVKIADAFADPDLLLAAHSRLKPGDQVRVLRYASLDHQRLVEAAEIVIAESSAGAVTFAPITHIPATQMPSRAPRATETVEEALQIAKVEHDYRLVEEIEEQNKIKFFKVVDFADGTPKTRDVFEDEQAAQDCWISTRASEPDYVVTDSEGQHLSPRFRTPQEAESWKAAEQKRRRVGG